ncbi:hypothetical protein BDF14DRAFT_562177 [Spinellus fusiger]|nr:hypothetical protein BDF14DRAFT_562177 [Spinellus fusiger]
MFLDGDDFAQLASNELKTKRLTVEEEFKDIQLELTQLQSLSANHEQQLEALQQSTQAFEEQIKVDKQEDALLALEKECLVLEEEELELKKELEQLNSHTDPDANPKTVIELYISMYRELGIHVLTKDGAIGKTRLSEYFFIRIHL